MELRDPRDEIVDIDLSRQIRRRFIRECSWGIPTEQAIQAICQFAPLIEIGSGGGYWAFLLRDAGCDILAFDNGDDTFQKKWTEVLEGGPEKILANPKRNLFLCWPPYLKPMASQCLKNFTGEWLIYIGEEEGGATCDEDFFAVLAKDFALRQRIEIPQWPNIHDYLWVFQRSHRPG